MSEPHRKQFISLNKRLTEARLEQKNLLRQFAELQQRDRTHAHTQVTTLRHQTQELKQKFEPEVSQLQEETLALSKRFGDFVFKTTHGFPHEDHDKGYEGARKWLLLSNKTIPDRISKTKNTSTGSK